MSVDDFSLLSELLHFTLNYSHVSFLAPSRGDHAGVHRCHSDICVVMQVVMTDQ